MPVLKSLSFTTLPKSSNDPVQARRTKFVARLEEQKLLLKDHNHFRTVHRWTQVNGSTGSARPPPSSRPSGPGGRPTRPVRWSRPLSLGPSP